MEICCRQYWSDSGTTPHHCSDFLPNDVVLFVFEYKNMGKQKRIHKSFQSLCNNITEHIQKYQKAYNQ
jgi:hypothetical protein